MKRHISVNLNGSLELKSYSATTEVIDLLERFIPNSEVVAYARKNPYSPDKFKALSGAEDDEEAELEAA